MKPIRALLTALALGVASLAMVACSDASANEGAGSDSPSATAPADPDAPVTSDDPTPAPTETPEWDHERVEEAAPIESFEVLVLESFPPQYRLKIVSGLASGCAAFDRTEVERVGNTFNVSVINTMPAPDAQVACTMIYGYHEQSVALEGIESGVEYTVNVNDKTMTFEGQ